MIIVHIDFGWGSPSMRDVNFRIFSNNYMFKVLFMLEPYLNKVL